MALSDDIFGLAGRLTSSAIKGAVFGAIIAAAFVLVPQVVIPLLTTGTFPAAWGAIGTAIGAGAVSWGGWGAAIGGGLSLIPGVDTFKNWFSSATSSITNDLTPTPPARSQSISPTPTRPRSFDNNIAQEGAGGRFADFGNGKTSGHSL